MPYKAVIFDLYGTLVDNFSSQAYDQVQVQMAKALDIPYPKFRQRMLETINDKSSGGYHSVEENILEICRRLNLKVDMTKIEQAAIRNYHVSLIKVHCSANFPVCAHSTQTGVNYMLPEIEKLK